MDKLDETSFLEKLEATARTKRKTIVNVRKYAESIVCEVV